MSDEAGPVGGDLRRTLVRRPAASGGPMLRLARRAGWTMITLGLLLIGFVVHQLYITDFFADRAQRGLEKELEARGSIDAELVPYLPGEDPTIGGVGDPSTTPGDFPVSPTDRFLLREPRPAEGEALGTIRIPDIGLTWTVVEGVGRNDLKSGAGHMPTTPLPGQPGNAVVSGHRTTFGRPFHNLDELEPGDLVFWDSPVIGTHTYVVRDLQVVRPTALWVTRGIAFDGDGVDMAESTDGAWLTLTTCHPKFSAAERLIVFAEIIDGPNAPVIMGEA